MFQDLKRGVCADSTRRPQLEAPGVVSGQAAILTCARVCQADHYRHQPPYLIFIRDQEGAWLEHSPWQFSHTEDRHCLYAEVKPHRDVGGCAVQGIASLSHLRARDVTRSSILRVDF